MSASSRLRFLLNRKIVLLGVLLVLAGGVAWNWSHRRPRAVAAAKIGFNARIQPILSENCYHCHGPDKGSRKAGLRLDRADYALAGGEHGPALVPGDPERSLVMRRIRSKDPQEVMPPPAMHNQLNAEEVALLEKWIAEGAHYEEHWAFVAPQRPALPAIRRTDWGNSAVDRFILARLEKEGLGPAPEADRPALIRRVTYDLTGLPPTPEETAAFFADQAPGAYERVVDRLLASPRYGEHRARYWLDVARYGDSHGLHGDYERSVWGYRDYVIRAFNANKPFDQFTRENLAGDMGPARSLDEQLASAFIRLGISSSEAGSIPQELRVNNQRERVEAYSAAYLGLTTGCAACHDHKFDPISQKDHYQLSAFFNNLTEHPNNGARKDWPPFIRLPAEPERAEYDRTLARKADVEAALRRRREQGAALVAQWLAAGKDPAQAVPARGLELRLKFDERHGAEFHNSAPGAAPASVSASGAAPVWGEDTWLWPSLRMDTTTRIALAAGDVEADTAFAVGLWAKPRYETTRDAKAPDGVLLARRAAGDHGSGWEIYFKGGRIQFRLAGHGALAIETRDKAMESDRWTHLAAAYDGSGRAAGLRLCVDGAIVPVAVLADDLTGSIRTDAPLLLARREPDDAPLRNTAYQDLRFYRSALSDAELSRLAREDYVHEIAVRPAADWNEDERHAVEEFFFARRDPESAALRAQLPALNAELARLAGDGPAVLVSEEAPSLAYADVLQRGLYSQRGERVRPGVPHFLPPLAPGEPRDRRGLADWTVSPQNPLTARVTVNRMWAEIFGAGLVETTEDFGVMGERPSHPELLDWLAVEFRESGWNVKQFYRLLVTSATYRQSARVEPAVREKDPRNRLLARGPRFRMDAEMLRDTVLAAGGLLVEKEGGPSVKPYQPPGIWEAGTPPTSNTSVYVQDHGEALYRRSLYTFWKRMATMPNMDTFDAPVRDTACTRRQRTTTPLQALVTLNDVQWLEAARQLAERLLRAPGGDDERLDQLGRILLARPWDGEEKAVLASALGKFRATYAHDAGSARRLLAIGESPVDPALPPGELAAWMLVASTAENLDATLNK